MKFYNSQFWHLYFYSYIFHLCSINCIRLRNNYSGKSVEHLFRRRFVTVVNDHVTKKKPTLILSDSCIKKLKEISERESKKYLRISVDGGGCSGFQYLFDLDDKFTADDIVFGEDNSQVIIDAVSLEYCAGATVDYHTELIRSGFRIVGNPKAEQGCSCGASFSIKLD